MQQQQQQQKKDSLSFTTAKSYLCNCFLLLKATARGQTVEEGSEVHDGVLLLCKWHRIKLKAC